MKIRSASVDELWEGAKLEFEEGRLCAPKFEIARKIYKTALRALRTLLG